MEISKIQISNCILLLFNFGKNLAEIKELSCEACGINPVGISTVIEWFTKLEKCDF